MSDSIFRRRTTLLTATLAAAAALALAASGTGSAATAAKAGSTTCTGANTKVTAQTVTRPVNHLLLTVKNTGSKTCHLYGYPALRFTDAQVVPPVVEDSQPQAVTTLRPGQSGYAGVSLSSAEGSDGYTAKTLSVIFQNRALDFVGSGVKVPLPAKGVYIDSSLRTTYWLDDPQDAISW
ncbi:DUF4232 domain-containing protein [Streptomyces sp. NPDC101776]|uniref:DUF4232 domain-containing protein n=1 Tax=Streptomyces sp. NPDC101776 TaxID=3366146 RepID=UPI00381CEF2A